MVAAAKVERLTPSLSWWAVYDPAVKAQLSSSAIRINEEIFLVDPVPIAPAALADLTADAAVGGIFLTNANHARAAGAFAAETGAQIRAAAATAEELIELKIVPIGDSERFETIAIEGAVAGELALYLPDDGGSVVIGDALINFGSAGFALLPAKYCGDQNKLRQSLRQLLDLRFERLLFAHGEPIATAAHARLEKLLA